MLRAEIEEGLRNREIVTLWGMQPNGKTHIYQRVWNALMIDIDGVDYTRIRSHHPENPRLDILPNVEISGLSKHLTVEKIMRYIMQSYKYEKADHMANYELRREFKKLMRSLRELYVIPVLAMDNIELMPERGYSIIKSLNEMRIDGKPSGVAALLSGDFTRRKMPPNFWAHCHEICVGKITFGEMAEFINQLVGPQYAMRFTPAAVEKLMSECSSTLEMAKIIQRSARAGREIDDKQITPEHIDFYARERRSSKLHLTEKSRRIAA